MPNIYFVDICYIFNLSPQHDDENVGLILISTSDHRQLWKLPRSATMFRPPPNVTKWNQIRKLCWNNGPIVKQILHWCQKRQRDHSVSVSLLAFRLQEGEQPSKCDPCHDAATRPKAETRNTELLARWGSEIWRRELWTKRKSRNSTKRESEKSTHRTPDRKGMRKLYLRADQPADYFTDSHLDRNQVHNSWHFTIGESNST